MKTVKNRNKSILLTLKLPSELRSISNDIKTTSRSILNKKQEIPRSATLVKSTIIKKCENSMFKSSSQKIVFNNSDGKYINNNNNNNNNISNNNKSIYPEVSAFSTNNQENVLKLLNYPIRKSLPDDLKSQSPLIRDLKINYFINKQNKKEKNEQ